MMNLFQLQEQLKDLSKQQLVNEMQSPSGNAPPFLVMTELQRRTRMENAAALEKGSPTTTVAQDAVNASGVPQGGIADMARSLAPQSDVTQNTGALTPQAGAMPQTGAAPVQAMQEGGLAGISRDLKDYKSQVDPAVQLMADRLGMTTDEYLKSVDPKAREQHARRIERNRMLEMDPSGYSVTMPTQEDLNQRYLEESLGIDTMRSGLTSPSGETSPSIQSFTDQLDYGNVYPEKLTGLKADGNMPRPGPYAMDQMIEGPMSGVLLDVGGSDLTVPQRLEMGQRGGGSSDYTPRPEYADPAALGLAGMDIARMREVERAQEIGANRGPRVSSMATPAESLIASLTPDAVQNVPMVEVDRSYQPQTMDATKLDMVGIRQSLIGPPREAVQNVPSETPAVYYDPYFQPDPGAVEGETTAQKISRLGGPFREIVPALADKYVLGPALSIPQSVMAGGSAAAGIGASVLGLPEIGQQYLDQAGDWQGDAVMLANEGYFGANAAQPQPQNLGDMTPGELLPPTLTDTAPTLTDTAPALTDTAPALTDTAPAVIQRAPGGGGASVGGISVPPPQSSEDRMLQQDKWLALARFGAALASSQAPTFGQALGQATTVGLDALGKARQDFLERKAMADQMALKRGALAARGGGGGKAPKPGLSANIVRALTALEPDILRAEDKLAQLEADINNSSTWGRSPPEKLVIDRNRQQEKLGELVGRRSAITRMGVGLNPMGTPDVAGSGEIAHNVAD